MSADLHTGRTPGSTPLLRQESGGAAAGHKSSLSVHMAPDIQPFGRSTNLSPEEYRRRRVALITGEPTVRKYAFLWRGTLAFQSPS